jgi:hypothetical protein
MRRNRLSLLSLLFPILLPAVSAWAQTADSGPPPVLIIGREDVKPGRMGAHEKVSTAYAALFAKASPDDSWLGLTPISGDDSAVLFLVGHPSFAAAEANHIHFEASLAQNAALKAESDRLDAQNAELKTSSRTAWFVHRPALSYHAPTMGDVAKSRLVRVTTYRIKPGHVPDWNDYVKTLNAAREKAGASWTSAAMYESQVGAAGGTFLIFQFSRGMAELDELVAKADERQKAIDAALGGDQVVKMRRQLISEILVEPATTNLYFINRAESHPGATFAALDPDFWTPKPAATATGKALATKKEAPKK